MACRSLACSIPIANVYPTQLASLAGGKLQCLRPHYCSSRWSAVQAERLQGFPPVRAYSSANEFAVNPRRVYVQHTIYKGKAAVTLQPASPKFKLTNQGALQLEKEGALLLNFARALGQRQYDWQNKQIFALSVTECAALVELAPGERLEFLHDPNMQKEGQGALVKSLRVEPPGDNPRDAGRGAANTKTVLFMSLNISGPAAGSAAGSYSLPLTKAEFAVIRAAANYIMPHLLGWDAFTTPNIGENVEVPDPTAYLQQGDYDQGQ